MPQPQDMLILLTIHLLWSLALLPGIAHRHRIPASAASWAAIVVLLPVVGTLLYWLAGYRRPVPSPAGGMTSAAGLERLLFCGCGTRPALHNRLEELHDGSNAFSSLIAALQRATRTIHLEYYIFRDDRIGSAIAEILIRKARAGVEVLLIYDAVGSWRLSRAMLRRLHRAGVRTAPYAPIRFPWFTPRAARRNHRKIVVVDGKVAYLGGINIAKYYLDGDDLGRWRDEHLRLEGDIVADLQRLFLADWAAAAGERIEAQSRIARHSIRRRLALQLAWAEEGPSRTVLAEAFALLIVRARRRVRICSPYFLPPTLLLDALRTAARSGVRVEVMIPACSDSRLTDLAADSYIDDLLDAGVALYRYDGGFLHAKVLIVDDTAASVGTANMDYRSLTANLEVTVFVRDRATVGRMASTFEADKAACRRIDRSSWHPARGRRIAGELLRLLAPLL